MRAVRRIIAAALLTAAFAATTTTAYAVERILQFVSDVKVERNGDLLVTETIRVQAELRDIRRGILRDFPTTYTRRDGTRVVVGFDVQSVTRDGTEETFATEQLNNGVRVRIGRADRFLTFGPHTYVITYRTTRQVGFFPDFDELYWNATGNGWTFPIDQAEARITLPEAVPFIQTAVYTGPQGAQGKDAMIVSQQPGRIVFRTTRPLPANQGLTVAASWQKGVVIPPTQAELLQSWIEDNLHLAVMAGGILLMFFYYAVAWFFAGRDPPSGTIIPLFAPPEGMSAAAVRYVRYMEFDDRAFAAALVDTAVRGHAKLVDSADERVIEKRNGKTPLPPAEQAMVAKLFSGVFDKVRLVKSNHARIGGAKTALSTRLASDYARLIIPNTAWASFGLFASIVVLAAITIVSAVALGSDKGANIFFGMMFTAPAGFFLGWLLTGIMPSGFATRAVIVVIGLIFTGIFSAIGYSVAMDGMSYASALPAAAPLFILPLAISAFSWMKAHTREGRRVTDQIEGLHQYLGVAEEDRLEFLHPPEKTPELFEKFLPYAIALDVENTWGARFAGVLATAAAAGATATWYSGRRDWASDPAGFASSVGEDLSQTVSSASTPPGSSGGSSSSSGSSGGGSSGGGGGGGGGSGW